MLVVPELILRLVQVLLTLMLILMMLLNDAETVEHSTEWRLTRRSDARPQQSGAQVHPVGQGEL